MENVLNIPNRRGTIRARDLIYAVLVIGIISTGIFSFVGGLRTSYSVSSNETFDESMLDTNSDVTDSIDNLMADLRNSDNIFSQVFIVLFKGFKTAILVLVSVFNSIYAMVMSLFIYLGIAEYIVYIGLMVSVAIIFTVWRALQGREGV